jgi:membrane protein DedA with SNARE-associated domain
VDPTRWDVPFPAIVAMLFVIVMLRANGTYWLGRLGTAGVRRTRLARLLESPGYLRATERIDRYGAPVVSLSFLTVGFQTLANLAAGATGMKLRHYLPAVTLGAVAWAFLYATLGTVGIDLLGDLWAFSPPLAVALVLLVAGGVLAHVAWQSRRRAGAGNSQRSDSHPL